VTLAAVELDGFVVGGQPTEGRVRLSAPASEGEGTVRMSGPALASGATITMRSSNTIATVPASILIPAGATALTFTITTRAVSLETNFDLTASLGDQVRSVPIRLTP
jgi:hypothetical protein